MTPFAKEYGEALYSLAADEGLKDRIHEETALIDRCFKEDPKFMILLQSRSIPEAERFAVLEEVFGGQAHKYVLNFIKILCERHALSSFSEIAQYIHQRYDDEHRILEATVTTAQQLSEDNARRIRERLEQRTGRKIRLIEVVDPAVIGGVRVEADGQCLDNTIATRLASMREHLVSGI